MLCAQFVEHVKGRFTLLPHLKAHRQEVILVRMFDIYLYAANQDEFARAKVSIDNLVDAMRNDVICGQRERCA